MKYSNKIENLIITIDPGKGGGIAHYKNGTVGAVKMPESVSEIDKYLKMLIQTYGDAVVFIEKVQTFRGKKNEDLKDEFLKLFKIYRDPLDLFEQYENYREGDDGAPGKNFGINKMLANYNQLLTIIELAEIPFVEVYPISWQSTTGLRVSKDKRTKTERKKSYKEHAEFWFPKVGKINLATADALCLVKFALIKYKSERDWINERVVRPKKTGLF